MVATVGMGDIVVWARETEVEGRYMDEKESERKEEKREGMKEYLYGSPPGWPQGKLEIIGHLAARTVQLSHTAARSSSKQ